MKKAINPLIYVIKRRQNLVISPNNITQITNKIYLFGELENSSKADQFVEKEMKDYPIYNS